MGSKVSFRLGGDVIEVIIQGDNLMFFDVSTGMITTLDGLKLNRKTTIQKFPELDGDVDWRNKAIKFLKEHIKSFNTDDKKIEYLINDLKQYGYEPLYKQKMGHRPKKV